MCPGKNVTRFLFYCTVKLPLVIGWYSLTYSKRNCIKHSLALLSAPLRYEEPVKLNRGQQV